MDPLSAPVLLGCDRKLRTSLIGTRAMLIEAPGEFDRAQQSRIWALAEIVSAWPAVEEAVVGVTNVMLVFRAPPRDLDLMTKDVVSAWDRCRPRELVGRTHDVPVIYGGELGFDLPAVAARSGLSEREVISIHAAGDYVVCAIGSSPGFGYLHGLDPRLFMPRKSVPSLRMLAGSVTIGGMQAGISVQTGPNGWNSIGWASALMFDPHRDPPCHLAPGDRVRFRIDGSSCDHGPVLGRFQHGAGSRTLRRAALRRQHVGGHGHGGAGRGQRASRQRGQRRRD